MEDSEKIREISKETEKKLSEIVNLHYLKLSQSDVKESNFGRIDIVFFDKDNKAISKMHFGLEQD